MNKQIQSIMKKYLIIAAVALVASVACNKVQDEAPARKITFEPASYVPQTRAHSLFSESISSFNCKAFMKGEGVEGLQNFFGDGETITPRKTDGTAATAEANVAYWAPAHDYYWPKSANSYVNFFSWYDTGAGPTSVSNGAMAWTNRTIDTGDNIMYADPAWHFQQNTTNNSQYDNDAVTSGVPTVFHHALAQVNFKAYATKTSVANLCTWTITLKNVAITNVYNQGTLNLTSTEPTASTLNSVGTWTSPAWTTTGTAASLTPADLTATATTSNGAQTLLANQSVLPQSLANIRLTFDLDITTTYTAGQSNQEIIPIEIPLGTSAGFNVAAWELNHKYTFIVKIEPSENKVYFDPAIVDEWVEEEAVEHAI